MERQLTYSGAIARRILKLVSSSIISSIYRAQSARFILFISSLLVMKFSVSECTKLTAEKKYN